MTTKGHCGACADLFRCKNLLKRAIELFEFFQKPPVIVKIWLIEAHKLLSSPSKRT